MTKKLLLLSCTSLIMGLLFFLFKESKPYKEIGKVKVQNLKNIHFELRQKNELDFTLGLDYRIISNKKEIVSWGFLTGTLGDQLKPSNFYASSVDSILYLTWGDTSEIYCLYDLKTHIGYPIPSSYNFMNHRISDSLLTTLKNKKPYLKANWKK